MKRFIFTSLFITGTLMVGCSSLNNSFNSYTILPASASEPVRQAMTAEPALPVIAASEEPDKEFKCPPFRYEFSGKGPELPEDKILAAGDDIYKIEQIERQHIKELRVHMAKMQRRLKTAMLEHEVACRMAVTQ